MRRASRIDRAGGCWFFAIDQGLPNSAVANGDTASLRVLNDVKAFEKRFDTSVLLAGEVLEHLPANPLRLLQFLPCHLSLQGYLILTTPNLYTRDKPRKMASRTNPTPAFPPHYKMGHI